MTDYSDTWGGDEHGASCPCCCDTGPGAFDAPAYDDDPYGSVQPTYEAPVYDDGGYGDEVFTEPELVPTVDEGPAWEEPAWQPLAADPAPAGPAIVGGHSITDGIEPGGLGSSTIGGYLITDATQATGFSTSIVGGVTADHLDYLAANAAIEQEAAQRAALGNAAYLEANGFLGGDVTSDPTSGPHPGVLMQQLEQLHRSEVNNHETNVYGERITNPYLTE